MASRLTREVEGSRRLPMFVAWTARGTNFETWKWQRRLRSVGEIMRSHLKLLSVRHPWCVSAVPCTRWGLRTETPLRNRGLVASVYIRVVVEDMEVEVR